MLDPNRQCWFAVYTKPREEHVALLNLERQAFQCYLPMTQKRRRRGACARRPHGEPLFPRYLFLRAMREQQNLGVVRSTRGAVGLVRAGTQLLTVPAAIIAGLKDREDPRDGLIPVVSNHLQSGDRVRVFAGPFAALEGIFEEHRGRARSLLLIEIMGRQTAVEVDERLVRRVV